MSVEYSISRLVSRAIGARFVCRMRVRCADSVFSRVICPSAVRRRLVTVECDSERARARTTRCRGRSDFLIRKCASGM